MAFCSNCGSEVKDSAKFCRSCGTPAEGGPAAGATQVGSANPQTRRMAFPPAALVGWGLAAVLLVVIAIAKFHPSSGSDAAKPGLGNQSVSESGTPTSGSSPGTPAAAQDHRAAGATIDIRVFSTSLSIYKIDTGVYPSTTQGLDALIHNPGVPNWGGPYLRNMPVLKADPWGHPYIYKYPSAHGRDFDIVSAGPDGEIGTADDIESWKGTNLWRAR